MSLELRRYTDVLSVIDTLKNKRITLTNSAGWIDKNDREALEMFGQRAEADFVVAYCMTEAPETFHHWEIFAGHRFGACIVFDKKAFAARMEAHAHVLHGQVKYLTWAKLRAAQPVENDALPFLKREVFKDEREYRVVASTYDFLEGDTLTVSIDLGMIKRVIFSSQTPRPLLDTLSTLIREFDGCAGMQLNHSRLTDNLRWREVLHEGRPALPFKK